MGDRADLQATEQALLDLQAQQQRTGPAALAMHRYAAAAIARNGDWRPAHRAMLELHVEQTPGVRMPSDVLPPDDWPPTGWAPYVMLKSLARWLVSLDGADPDAVLRRQVVAMDDVTRRAGRALDFARRLDGGCEGCDEIAEDIIDANERMGDALTEIGMALGLPRPDAQTRWGAPEILAAIEQLRARDVAALALIDDLLHPWNTGRKVHPGYAGIAAGNVPVLWVDRWNRRRAELVQPEGDTR